MRDLDWGDVVADGERMNDEMAANWTAQVDDEAKLERTYIVCVKVSQQDADLLKGDSLVPQMIRTTFAGTAIHVIECEPEQPYNGGVPDYKHP